MVSLEQDVATHGPFPMDAARITAEAGARDVVLTAEATGQIAEATGGVTTLVREILAALPVAQTIDDPEPALQVVRDRLRDAVRTELDEAEQVAATAIAVGGSLTVAELSALGPDVLAAGRSLRARGLATASRIDGHLCHRLVGLAQDALCVELDERGDVRPWRARLRALREELGVLDCGLETAYEEEDWSACGRILDRWWPQLAFSSSRPLSHQVVFDMPRAALEAHPGAWHRAEYLGLVEFRAVDDESAVARSDVAEMCRTGEAWYFLRRTSLAMTARRVHHRHDEALRVARHALPVAEAGMRASQSRTAGFCSYWFLHAGITHELAGDFDGARRMYRSGWQVRHVDELGFCAHDLAGKMAALSALRGDLAESRRWIETGRHLPSPAHWANPYIRVGYDLADLTIAIDSLDHRRASTLLDALPDHLKGEEFWAHIVLGAVRHLLSTGAGHEALQLLDDARRMNNRSTAEGAHSALWHAARSEALLAVGRGQHAAAAIRDLPDDRLRAPLHARLRLLCGHPDDAHTIATTALQRGTWRRPQVELLLIDAVACHRLDDGRQAVKRVRDALDLMAVEGSRRPLLTVPRAPLVEISDQVPELAEALKELDRTGECPIYPDAVDLVALSEREHAVLQSLAAGNTLAETAATHFVSLNTVKTQVRSLYAKLDVNNRRDLIVEASTLGLITGATHPG